MSKPSSPFNFLLFSVTVSILVSVSRISSSGIGGHELGIDTAMFVFGDSIYEPGNNNYLNISYEYKANYPPYGETFFRYPTGRVSDGRIIPDFLAMYMGLPLWEAYLQPGRHQFTNGANFASAGAGVLPESNPLVLNLRIQLQFFKEVTSLLWKKLGDSEAKRLLINAVYLFSIGGVDYVSFTGNATHSEQQACVNLVVGNLTNILKEIYGIGGRKFAFQNISPLGCLPQFRQIYGLTGISCVDELQAVAILHNAALSNATRALASQLPGFRYSIFDYFSLLTDRMINPSKFGFKVRDVACCGSGSYRGVGCGIDIFEVCENPNEYVFWNGGHPTEHAYSQLAELFWNGTVDVAWPVNFKQLVFDSEIQTSSKHSASLMDE